MQGEIVNASEACTYPKERWRRDNDSLSVSSGRNDDVLVPDSERGRRGRSTRTRERREDCGRPWAGIGSANSRAGAAANRIGLSGCRSANSRDDEYESFTCLLATLKWGQTTSLVNGQWIIRLGTPSPFHGGLTT